MTEWVYLIWNAKDGRLYGEDGRPYGKEVFSSENEAEKFLRENDLRATIK